MKSVDNPFDLVEQEINDLSMSVKQLLGKIVLMYMNMKMQEGSCNIL
jgi:hypothetical protein